ncbi:MAG: hypothetical protein OSB62_07875 [Alphaproteobacteria bacterium]|nr:hypothetical protein [Alphaproteobacteria bacterium]
MNATKRQAQYQARKIENLRSELLYLFPNMNGYNATCKVRGDKSLPVIEITWYPGYTKAGEKPSSKMLKKLNKNWQERHKTVLERLIQQAHFMRGRPQTSTTFNFRHKAGYLKE